MRNRTSSKNGGTNGRSTPASRPGEEERGTDSTSNPDRGFRRSIHRLTPVLILFSSYLLVAALMVQLPQLQSPGIEIGKPSPLKVIAPRDITIPDHERTAALRLEKSAQVAPVLNDNTEVVRQAIERLDRYFDQAQRIADSEQIPAEERNAELARILNLPIEQQDGTIELLLKYSRYQLLHKTLKDDLGQLYGEGIVQSNEIKDLVLQHRQKGVYVVDSEGEMALRAGVEAIRTIKEAQNRLKTLIEQQFNKLEEDAEPRQLALELGKQTLEANLSLNKDLWNERKQEAANQVQPVQALIQRNQKLIDEGEIVPSRIEVLTRDGQPVEMDTNILLAALYREESTVLWGQVFARILLLLVPLVLFGIYIRRYHHDIWRDLVNLSCLLGVMVLVIALGRLLAYLGGDLQYIGYAMPVALTGVLVTILLNAHVAFFSVLILMLYSGLMFQDAGMMLVHLCCGLVAIFSTSGVRRRIDISWTGAKVALTCCGVALLLYFMNLDTLRPGELDNNTAGLIIIFGITHGILTIMLSGFLLPLLENLMGVVTDIQMLELSQKNDILRQLEAEAPGTYQHSLNVANLAESAADAVGANGLQARVAALYHDIGKLAKPIYFSENQVRDNDKRSHDKLTPSMSRLLIINHIKDGLELADKEKLPNFIQDAIAQHHGTTLLTFFYDKALRDDAKDVVNEEDYRYPGPKPQSVEIAIIMLADSLEAASRSLPLGISPGELYQFVRRIINEKFVDNQFENCDLTLSDLHRLTEAFSRSLVSILHRRVAYPVKPGETDEEAAAQAPKKNKPRESAGEVPVGAGASVGTDESAD